jgi:hypothetical protein
MMHLAIHECHTGKIVGWKRSRRDNMRARKGPL